MTVLITSAFHTPRSVWQMEVKSTLTRTSSRPGGATSTSSTDSGSPGPHATAAARNQPRFWSLLAQTERKGGGGGGLQETRREDDEGTFAFDGLSSGAGAVGQVAVPVPVGGHGASRSLSR
jgi:hypothetical protein